MSYRLIAVLGLLLVLACGCGRSRDDLLREGRQLQGEGNLRGAIVLYKNVLEKNPGDSEARFLLADCYLAAERFDFAEKEFRKVSLQDPSRAEVRLRLAELYVRTRRSDPALEELEAYLKTGSRTPLALDLLGRSRSLKKDLAGAEKAFREALRLDPEMAAARLHLADCLARGGREREAREMLAAVLRENPKDLAACRLLARLETAAGQTDAAIALYRRMGELDPGNAEAAYSTGLLLLEKGDAAGARRIADGMLEKTPGLPEGLQLRGLVRFMQENYEEAAIDLTKSLEGRSDLTAIYFLGLSHYKRGQEEIALNQFQRFLDIRPEAVQPRVMVATILVKQRRSEDAIRVLERVLKSDDGNAAAHSLMGSALLARGDHEAAMQEFDRALSLDPGLAEAHLRKGVFRFSRGNFEAGEADLARAVEAAPGEVDSRLMLALRYLQRRNFAEAIRLLEQGLRGNPDDALLYNYLAVAHFARNDAERALDCLRRAKQRSPDYLGSYYNLGTYHLRKGDLALAAREYEAILARGPGEVRALLLAGETAERAGKSEQALHYYTRADRSGTPEGAAGMAAFRIRKGEKGEALSTLQAALDRHPGDARLLAMKGSLLLQENAWEAAAAAFEMLEKGSPGAGLAGIVDACSSMKAWSRAEAAVQRYIKANPKGIEGHLALARLHERRGNPDAALAHLRSLGERRRSDPALAVAYAGVLERGKRWREAIAAYEEIVKRFGEAPQTLFALGALHDGLGEKGRALGYYSRVLERDPDFTPALNNLACLYAERPSERSRALDLARRAHLLEPRNPWVLDTLGYLLVRAGKTGEGTPLLEKAASRLPGSPTVQYHLALAYCDQNRQSEAAEALRRALALGAFPEEGEANKLLAGLSETGKAKRQ